MGINELELILRVRYLLTDEVNVGGKRSCQTTSHGREEKTEQNRKGQNRTEISVRRDLQ